MTPVAESRQHLYVFPRISPDGRKALVRIDTAHGLAASRPEPLFFVAESLNNLANVLARQGDYDAAERLLRETLAIDRRTLGEGHWRLADVRGHHAVCLTLAGRYPEAETLLLAAHARLEEQFGEENPRTRLASERLARLYAAWGRADRTGRDGVPPPAHGGENRGRAPRLP
jgi:tetratricopeptide (TPR) repeat protein